MKFTPASIAVFSAAIDSLSSTLPHDPPIAQAPKLISETFQPVRPNGRYCIFPIVTNGENSSGRCRVQSTASQRDRAKPGPHESSFPNRACPFPHLWCRKAIVIQEGTHIAGRPGKWSGLELAHGRRVPGHDAIHQITYPC